MTNIRGIIFPLISFFATVVLTMIATYVVKLDEKGAYLIFATGASVSLALALIEQKVSDQFEEFQKHLTEEFKRAFETQSMIEGLEDTQLQNEVLSLIKGLSSGEVPPHITALRIPQLYAEAESYVYASNVCHERSDLLRWAQTPRFKRIVEASRSRSDDGVRFVRTFVLSRTSLCGTEKTLDDECRAVLEEQVDAGIEVRIIWSEELISDTVSPTRRLDRNFTIFDNIEVVDTTDVQVIYRKPSKRLSEIIELSLEQMKYSEIFKPS